MERIKKSIRAVYPVGEEALEALTGRMERRVVPKNHTLVESGVKDRELYFIERGITRSILYHDGQETTTWFSQEGDITFGMGSLYFGRESDERVETLEECEIYVIPIAEMNRLYERHIDLANWGRKIHEEGYYKLVHIFAQRLQLTSREKYERFLVSFPGVVNRVKLRYVAEFLGMSIYTLSRVRSARRS